MNCPNCKNETQPEARFCSQCGHSLRNAGVATPIESGSGERKHVVVLFSDLSNYTRLSEKLDPEKIKELMARILEATLPIIEKYDGHLEQILGDGIMVLFGVAESHEDDALRALKTARGIHRQVNRLSGEQKKTVGAPLTMHTGISSGLVVTGRIDRFAGRHGVAGDTVNLASRLSGLAQPDDILVDEATFRSTQGTSRFEALPPSHIKGKAEPIPLYRFLGPKSTLKAVQRHSESRSPMIGRTRELRKLRQAFEHLRHGKTTTISLLGEAGTGKSRLIQAFRSSLHPDEIQWFETMAYSHSRNIPYSLMTDLFRNILGIDSKDPIEKVHTKMALQFGELDGVDIGMLPLIAGFETMDTFEAQSMSPEFWRARALAATVSVSSAVAAKKPTIFCLEDLHWADESSLEMIRAALPNVSDPLLIICAYRPGFQNAGGQPSNPIADNTRELRLKELSPAQSAEMLSSLLNGGGIPGKLQDFVREKSAGNPFYLKEIVNALMETKALIRQEGQWSFSEPLQQSNIPSSIRGVISSRLDRLTPMSRRVLKEASVIGRSFSIKLLGRIMQESSNLQQAMTELVKSNLIHPLRVDSKSEYAFKNALFQEVSYKRLLRKERREIHERIGLAIEDGFGHEMPEPEPTLAYHFQRGENREKAVIHLIRSGEKALQKYALASSHRYFKKALELVGQKEVQMIEIVNKWAFAFYYQGNNRDLLGLLQHHRPTADKLEDPAQRGMFYAWLGCAHWHKGAFKSAYRHLQYALQLGKSCNSRDIIGYACAWLSWVCTEIGQPGEAIDYAKSAITIYETEDVDPYIFFNAQAGKGYACWHMGKKDAAHQVGQKLIEFGQKRSNPRSQVLGHCCLGWSHLVAGDIESATRCFDRAVAVSADPWYAKFPKLAMVYGYASCGQIDTAEEKVNEILAFSEASGIDFLGAPANFFNGLIQVVKGDLNAGTTTMESQLREWQKSGSRLRFASFAQILGQVYAGIHAKTVEFKPRQLGTKVSPAAQKALAWFDKSISVAEKISIRWALGNAYLNKGQLEILLNHRDAARDSISTALTIFRQCDSEVYVKKAVTALAALQKLP
jgi:class 3 adenylate cyclase/tetratricopeptide (TPR) repeat protein